MNIDRPVSILMTQHLKTVAPTASLMAVKEIMDVYGIHHVPVTNGDMPVGIISRSDLNHFLHAPVHERSDELLQTARLKGWKVEEVMTNELVFISSKESIRRALEIFRNNLFHALPVVDDHKLVGIITTFDILDDLLDEATILHERNEDSDWGKRRVI